MKKVEDADRGYRIENEEVKMAYYTDAQLE